MFHRFKNGFIRNVISVLAITLTSALLSQPARAANSTLQGTIATDDAVRLFDFTVAAAAAVDIRSYGYAGGTTSTGTTVAGGGFDTILTLFNASGVFLNENDDGAGVSTDPLTGLAADARITANLAPGTYILALTQYDNFSIGNLADGFGETGHPNFTADPSFASGGSCPGSLFRDISGTDGRCRTGNWTLGFSNVASVTAVPEPAALSLAGAGFALLLAGCFRRRNTATSLAGGLIAVLAAGRPLLAQSGQNPDFTNVNDVLHGNRTLLKITDLQVVALSNDGPNGGLNFSQLMTSNSSVTGTSSTSAALPPDIYIPSAVRSFSGSMFNQPQAVVVTEVNASHTSNNSYLVTTNIQNAGPWFSAVLNPYTASSFTAGAMADFNQDGYDDFAFSLDDGSIGIATAADVNNPWAGSSGPYKLGPLARLDLLTDMAAGDFKGDGQYEIAGLNFTVVDGIQLVIYSVDPKSLTITPASTYVFNTPLGFKIQYASIARGRFNTTTHDQLAVTFSSAQGPSIVQIVDFMPGTLTPVGGPQLTASTVTIPYGYLQLQTGKFGAPGNPYDQIVFHMSSGSDGGRFFQVLSANPADLTLTPHSGITYNQLSCASGIEVGNFDHQQTNQHDPSSQIALLYCNPGATTMTMNIYSVDPQTFDVQNPPNSSLGLSINPQSGFPSFAAADLQGRSLELGAPTKFTISNTTPSVITAVPPMHIDYITPVGGNKPEVLNLSYVPDGFNSAFTLVQQSTTGGSTTHTLSWSAGVDVSTQYDYQIGDPDEGTGARYSAAFHAASEFTGSSDNSTINYATSTFDATKTAKTADVVIYDQSRLNVWVYPVIGQTVCPATIPNCSPDQKKPLTIQFSGPDNIESGSVSADLLSATWYQPTWEWGNVLSYPATKDQLALIYPSLTSNPNLQLSTGLTFYTDNSSTQIQDTWSANTEQGATSSLANTTSFDVTLSAVDAVGVTDVAGTKLSASLKLSGSVGLSKLQTNSAKIEASNGVDIQAVAKFLDPGNYAYEVAPFILGSAPPAGTSGVSSPYQQPAATVQTFGPLKTAYTANPTSGAWWNGSAYRQAPDIALNHPSRWVATYPSVGSTLPSNCRNYGKGASDVDCADIAPYYDDNHQPLNPWNSEFLAMRGFFITRADSPGAGPQLGFARAGDQLDLAVRVYNYSLQPVTTGNQVHVRFYAMPWDSSNSVQAGDSILVGETVASPIPPFDPTQSDLNWRLIHAPTPFDTTAYAGKYFAFWVVVWMEDSSGALVKEVDGHGLTSLPGVLVKPSDVPLEMAIAADDSTAVSYSNNVGFYHYAFPVVSPNVGLGAPTPENLADITLKSVSAAKTHVQPGELDEITATLRAGVDGGGHLKVYFYDGDPDAGGQIIGIETAWFQPRTITRVPLPYHAPKDGVHQIWAVINRGTANQVERHTAPIVVGNTAAADRNHWNGGHPLASNDSQ